MNVKSNSRTLPNCARCSNHGLKIKLRSHKRFCAYRNCNCEKCKLTNDRQRDMALQTAMRRAHALDESRVLVQGQIPEQPKVPMPIAIKNEFVSHENDDFDDMSNQTDNDRPDSGFDAREFNDDSEFSTLRPVEAIPRHSEFQNNMDFNGDEYQDNGTQTQHDFIMKAEHIVTKFNCVHEMVPLMYALVKSTRGNIEMSERLLDEGRSVIQEHVRKHNLNMFDGKPMRRY
ncbi:doublesex- and mab-3-related transcription factor dmd-4-like [Chironomus tepperi]|uniref:doublesex- and mab-3-related transcription factor dmd-4-like n=1 Tax=Chironomus tepperi TaxID=113505 RepID=UPI00391EF90A